MTKQDVLDQCRIEGNVVFLPVGQLDRKLYMEVNKALQGAGGNWNRGKKGFVFPEDPSELLGRVKSGEKVNLKKEFQFFATPSNLADRLVRLAGAKSSHDFEEPSAGQGAIVEAILRAAPDAYIDCVELMPLNAKILREKNIANAIAEKDYLSLTDNYSYDRIIANPPFTKNQDIDHIKQMYSRLKRNGRLVSCASTSWERGSQKKQVDFRNWLTEVGAEVEDIEAGTFKESGTMIAGKIVVINK